jgi:ubiquinone/menaquinone biosynthesis C-methylase UbiE
MTVATNLQAKSPHWWLCLLVAAALTLAAAPLARAGDYELAAFDSLAAEYKAAYENEDYQGALDIAKEMSEVIWMKHADTVFNIARLYCTMGDKAKAHQWLQMAVDAGYWNAYGIRQDDCFKQYLEERPFKDIMKSAWTRGYIFMLERDEREDFQKSEEIMAALAFKDGERVADIGAGSGYFTIPIARAVGPKGEVLAVDIRQEMLDYIETRLEVEELENVKLMKVESADPMLPEGGLDTIIMIDTLHYVKDRAEYAKKLRAGLAPGGRLVIIDYRPKPWEERPWGPAPQQQFTKEEYDADMAVAGLKPVEEYDFLPEQYFIVYQAE